MAGGWSGPGCARRLPRRYRAPRAVDGRWKTGASSSKRLHEAVDQPVELRVPLALAVDLAHGVDDRGVVLAPEALADLRQGGVGQGLGQVHGDLAGKGHLLGVVLG